MVTQVNGTTRAGEFLTGSLDYFTLVTVVPCFPTQVKAPLSEVLAALNATALSATKSITVNSVTYTTNATYTDALAKQSNLDTLINVFSTRANPVVVNAYVIAGVANVGAVTFAGYSTATDLGSAYNSATRDLYTVKLAGERSGAWFVGSQGNFSTTADNTNQFGYQFLAALNGVAITDLDTPVVTGSDTFITSGDATNLNTLAVRDEDLRRQINAA
jgi:hypothetical protein